MKKEIKEKIKEIIGVNKNLTIDNLTEHKTCQILELFQQERQRIIKEIEKMKKKYEPIDDMRGVHDEQAVGYNQALEELIKSLTNK